MRSTTEGFVRCVLCVALTLCSLAAAPLTHYQTEYGQIGWRFGLLLVALWVARIIARAQANNQTSTDEHTRNDDHAAPNVSFGGVVSKLHGAAAAVVSAVACLAISAELGELPAVLVALGTACGFALGCGPGRLARTIAQALIDLGIIVVSLCSQFLNRMQSRDTCAAEPATMPLHTEPARPEPIRRPFATTIASVAVADSGRPYAHESGRPGWFVPTACFVVGLGILLCLGMLVPDVDNGSPAGGHSHAPALEQTWLPVLAPIEDQVAMRGERLVFEAALLNASAASVESSDPGPSVRFRLGDVAPFGMRVDPATGIVSWTPGDDVEAGQYVVTIRAEIGDDPALSDEECFSVWLRDPDSPPMLAELSDHVLQPGEPLMMEIKLADIGSRPGPLRFELASTAPAGAHIHPEAGILTWAPDDGDRPGVYPIVVRVSNAEQPNLADQQTLRVLLSDAPRQSPPIVAEVSDQVTRVGEELTVPIVVTDAGSTGGRLRFSLRPPTPRGARIDPDTGVFTWTPGELDGGANHQVIVRAQCKDEPSLRAEATFSISVIRVFAPATTAAEKSAWMPAATAKLDPTVKPAAVVGEPQPLPAIETPAANEPAETPMLKLSAAPDPIQASDPNDAESEPAFTNSIGMHLLLLPAGEFDMGSSDSAEQLAEWAGGPADRFSDELPQHRVQLSRSFYMGMHEVTVGQFRAFVRATGYTTDAERNGHGAFGIDTAEQKTKLGRQFNWQNPGWQQSDDHPVVNVTWNDATAFCRWLSGREGRRYRLPTEAQWEYACRAGTSTRYCTGDDDGDLDAAAHFGSELFRRAVWPEGDRLLLTGHRTSQPFTVRVGQLEPNQFNLYDMHGNVFEWCDDYFARDYYGRSPLVDPKGPDSGATRVIRGGSFYNLPLYCRSSFRNGFAPDTAVPYLGFRVVVEADNTVNGR